MYKTQFKSICLAAVALGGTFNCVTIHASTFDYWNSSDLDGVFAGENGGDGIDAFSDVGVSVPNTEGFNAAGAIGGKGGNAGFDIFFSGFVPDSPEFRGNGGNGGNATSIALTTANENTIVSQPFFDPKVSARASATGGNGGTGNPKIVFLFSPTQYEGLGGNGGTASAQARATSSAGHDVSAEVFQQGGAGGASYTFGGKGADSILDNAVSGSTSGSLSLLQTAVGGEGGAALIAVDQINLFGFFEYPDLISLDQIGVAGLAGNAGSNLSISDSLARSLSITSNATGGVGGFSANQGGNGGIAQASASATSTIEGNISVSVTQTGGGGGAGLNGGNGADSVLNNAVSASTGGSLSLSQIAVGGDAGNGSTGHAGLAGNAGSSISIVDSLASSLVVTSIATGGNGNTQRFGDIDQNANQGGGSNGGIATANATASSTIGSDVSVIVAQDGGFGGFGGNGGDGADSILTNAASGSTSGALSLLQSAIGGNAGGASSGYSGQAGNAVSILSVEDSLAKSIDVRSIAEGGLGGEDNYQGSNGGVATAKASAKSSIGGNVSVNVSQFGGSGSKRYIPGEVNNNGGNGADSILENAAEGSTSGILILSQTAIAGDAGVRISGDAALAGKASSIIDIQDALASSIVVNSEARGGTGGTGTIKGSDGGLATAKASVSSTIGSDVSVTVSQIGGAGGFTWGDAGNGSDSVLENAASGSTSGALLLSQTAIAGDGGLSINGISGQGGDAVSTLSIVDSQASSLTVIAEAVGGANAGVNNGGTAKARADAISTIGSDVSVSVTQIGGHGGFVAAGDGGNGADSILENATSGSTRGTLFLSQTAIAGDGGSSRFGNNGQGGNAVSTFSIVDSQASSITVKAEAQGGSSGSGRTGATNGGIAEARANVASTIGGDVSVSVTQIGGHGGSVEIGDGGNGTDSILENAATGSTGGALFLSQTAFAGEAGSSDNGQSGQTGKAVSTFFIVDSKASSLRVNAEATGGNGGSSDENENNGGIALASANISSTIGSEVSVNVLQRGGNGGSTGNASGGNGADSILENAALGSTSGVLSLSQTAIGGDSGWRAQDVAGHAGNAVSLLSIVDSKASALSIKAEAIGGTGVSSGDSVESGGIAQAQAHGVSTIGSDVSVSVSQASGIGFAKGSSEPDNKGTDSILNNAASGFTTGALTLSQSAVGGDAGFIRNPATTGSGGNASSRLSVIDDQAKSLNLFSSATGGSGATTNVFLSEVPRFIGNGGNATAYANAQSSRGGAEATAVAKGGDGLVLPGLVNAQANANGISGSKSTSVVTTTGISLTTRSRIDEQTSGVSESVAAVGQPLATTSPVNNAATAIATVLPQAAEAQAALAGQDQVSRNFDFESNNTPLLLANFSVLNTATTGGVHHYESALNLSLDTSTIVNTQDLLIGFLNPTFSTSQILSGDTLIFSYSVSGVLSQEFEFDAYSFASGFNFFNGRTLDLGALTDLVDDSHILNLAFNLELKTQTENAGLSLGLIVGNSTFVSSTDNPISSVPLPASIWFLLSGLSGLVGLSRRKNLLTS